MFSKTAIAATLLSAVHVSAHQNFIQFWVNDETPGYETAIRMPPSNSPVTNITSNDITCNVNGNDVPSGVSTFAANEGDEITVQWTSSNHPGPITHFLYGPVDNASLATGIGEWFKIDEWDSTNGTWASEIMDEGNMTYTFNLPTGLESGDYLLRSEMLALHGSTTVGGAQFFIGCGQLSITGTGTTDCSPSITLPGDYNATADDIYISNFYYGFDISTYTAPGGAVATCGAASGSAVATTTSAAAIATTSSSASTSIAVAADAVTSSAAAATSAVTASTFVTKVASSSKSCGHPSSSTASATVPAGVTFAASASGSASTGTSSSSSSSGSVALYGQCGGSNWTGATTCAAGTCTVQNDFYSQCV